MKTRIPLGAISDKYFERDTPRAKFNNGPWVFSRPYPFYSLPSRLRQAWDVLRYRADAIYWRQDIQEKLNT